MSKDEQIEFEPVGSPYVETPKKSHNKLVIILSAVVILALIVGTVIFFCTR